MSRDVSVIAAFALIAGALPAANPPVLAQTSGTKKPRVVTVEDAKPTAGGPETVVIRREPLRLIDPRIYQVPLHLEPIRMVQLAASVDGEVQSVLATPGRKVDAQTEAIRLDSREQQLLLERAKAKYRAAQIKVKLDQSKESAELVELAEANLQAAKADRDLAELRLDRMRIRVPFDSEVFRVSAVVGQFVRAGEPLVQLGDTSRLRVEIPVDRTKVSRGDGIELRIEETTISAASKRARVESLLPISPRFEPLRNLVRSVALAVVIVDNSQQQFRAWQTVHSPLIPRHWVTEIPTESLANRDAKQRADETQGDRKVQVVRDNVIRDVPVQLLGQVGNDRLFVSGAFDADDEVIVSASIELSDGTEIRAAAVAATSTTTETPRSRAKNAGADRPNRPQKGVKF